MERDDGQRPGIMDSEVRADVRERLQAAVKDAFNQLRGQAQPAATDNAASNPVEAPAAPPQPQPAAPAKKRPLHAGPYPHGDVDLSMLPANVTPARPNRARGGRRFYFIRESEQTPPPAASAPPQGQVQNPAHHLNDSNRV